VELIDGRMLLVAFVRMKKPGMIPGFFARNAVA